MALTPEQTRVLDEFDKMFVTEGWQMFVDEIRQNQESLLPRLLSLEVKEADLNFLKGKNDVYNSILGLKSLLDQVRKQHEDIEFDNE